MKRHLFFLLFLLFCGVRLAEAHEIYLKNGDKLTGTVISGQDDPVVIKTEAMGTVTVRGQFIESIEPLPEPLSSPMVSATPVTPPAVTKPAVAIPKPKAPEL